MDREIKFRGKRIDNNEWVYGYYFKDKDGKSLIKVIEESFTNAEYNEKIILELDYEVIPETVGQFTGLKESRNLIGEYDKNKIYESDIIQEDGWDDLYLVEYDDYKFIAKAIRTPDGNIFTKHNKDLDEILWAVKVGNKYDNPEL